MLEQAHYRIVIETRGPGFTDVTARLTHWLSQIDARDGLLTLFLRHTSASLVIQENADPDVGRDLADAFKALAREDTALYRHVTEGPDDMPAHIRSALTQTQLSIPVRAGKPVLGTWQGIFLFEHRIAPQQRHVALHLLCD